MITPHTEKAARRFLHIDSMIRQRRKVKTGPLTLRPRNAEKSIWIPLWPASMVGEKKGSQKGFQSCLGYMNPSFCESCMKTVSVGGKKKEDMFFFSCSLCHAAPKVTFTTSWKCFENYFLQLTYYFCIKDFIKDQKMILRCSRSYDETPEGWVGKVGLDSSSFKFRIKEKQNHLLCTQANSIFSCLIDVLRVSIST